MRVERGVRKHFKMLSIANAISRWQNGDSVRREKKLIPLADFRSSKTEKGRGNVDSKGT